MRMLYCSECKAVTDVKMVQSKWGSGKWVECMVCNKPSSSFAGNFDEAYAKWAEENPQPPTEAKPMVYGNILRCGQHALSADAHDVIVTLFDPITDADSLKTKVPLNACYFKLGKRYHVMIREELDNDGE